MANCSVQHFVGSKGDVLNRSLLSHLVALCYTKLQGLPAKANRRDAVAGDRHVSQIKTPKSMANHSFRFMISTFKLSNIFFRPRPHLKNVPLGERTMVDYGYGPRHAGH